MTKTSQTRRHQLIAVVAIVAVAWNLIGNLVLPGVWYVPANMAVAGGLLVFARWAGLGWDDLGLEWRWVGRGLVIGLGVALLIAAVIAIGVAIPSLRTFFDSDDVATATSGERWYTALVRIPIGTVVFEEVLFRSVLLGALLGLTSVRRAVVISAAAFGLWHVVPGWEAGQGSTAWAVAGFIVITVVITSVAGVGFALLRMWSNSIVAPILAHTATNSFAYVGAIVVLDLVD
jgi:membrane protease YdiL (CAAX protease family)